MLISDRYEIIEKVVLGKITRKEVMFELNKFRQQIYRLIKLYHFECKEGFIHKNRGKPNSILAFFLLISPLMTFLIISYVFIFFSFSILKLKL